MCCSNGDKLGISSTEKLTTKTDLSADVPPLHLPEAVLQVAKDFESIAIELRKVQTPLDARELLFDALIFCDSLRRIVERVQQDKLREMGKSG